MSFSLILDQCFAFGTNKNARTSKKVIIAIVIILLVWLSIVIITETRHEFWRDEVRALSISREAVWPWDLFTGLHNEGHPVVWYLLLFFGKSIVNTPLVLPLISVLIGFLAVAIFMFYAPFPLWFKCLFIFCALPLYEYSVMARNYGISMLLLFIAAALYAKRGKHPYWYAVILVFLANTNAHSAVLTCLLSFVWVCDIFENKIPLFDNKRWVSLYLPLLIVLSGILLCLVTIVPSDNTSVTSITTDFNIGNTLRQAYSALTRPYITYGDILPGDLPYWILFGLLISALIGLIGRKKLFLAALSGQIGLGLMFRIVYPGLYRHQGLFLIFLLVLYWILNDEFCMRQPNRILLLLGKIGLYGAVGILVINNIILAQKKIQTDLTMEKSSSKALGSLINQKDTYENAIIIAEPDYLIESLPYYVDNKIYLLRENCFGTTVSFTTKADTDMALGELLSTAQSLKALYNQRILIVLGYWHIEPQVDGISNYPYNRVFTWTHAEVEYFYDSTNLIADFNSSLTDENYLLFELK